MTVRLTIVGDTGTVSPIEVSPTTTISTLSLLIQSELSIAASEQDLRHNGRQLSQSATVASSGLSDGDLIMVSRKSPAQPSHSSAQAALRSIRSNPTLMHSLRAVNPDLYQRVMAGDPSVLQAISQYMRNAAHMMTGMPSAMGASRQFTDPMSADAQKAIEERIRQENVLQNMEAAMEHNPESFGSVVMLFVDCKVNSVDGVKAFVDSGAQATIISKQCAERCNILRLLDSRFAGLARGVGTATIYGRIHLALLTLGNEVFEVSFTVMDAVGGEFDILLGLDMLRKHQACIDLKKNCLCIGSTEVPFLAEKDIPPQMRASVRAISKESTHTQGAADVARSASNVQMPLAGGNPSAVGGGPVSRLMEMGFTRSEVEEALRLCNGDVDQAAAHLAAGKYGF